ncbi:MAG: hypothetical protein F2667_02125 [Actinobacteria bacterium]|uniref:Unannotated protein n=1 Tax=freshwater metagenome TaxID=449393 RepID=A0A6J6NVM9_9ZZZZ|nr:hypothetical protein [Actinomycetota bacterium]
MVTVLLGLALTGCGSDDAPETSGDGDASAGLSVEDCAVRLPDSVLTTLGWASAGQVEVGAADTCELAADAGDLRVRRLPMAPQDGEELADSAQTVYDDRCAGLDAGQQPGGESPTPAAGEVVDWLSTDVTACAVLSPDGQGINELVVLSGETVGDFWVVADDVVEPELVREALDQLVSAAVPTFTPGG